MSRGRGEGSVYYHEKLNLWCASITIYVASKRKRRTAYAHSQKEAINKLDALRQRPDAPRATENVAAYLDRWLALIEREREIKPRSLAKHEHGRIKYLWSTGRLGKHILAHFEIIEAS